ncbi:hypothetical protein Solca_1457 [Solitalea canadensis DSM 3403]|uniref:YD repeat-containing protein n=2 Tax=Solitalea canadensis TaxID=995 RepID=H8KVN4_SOLCM|nr:hypothetical protein Solca_1457 [Solitalea canadensis DSM 3403]
MVAGATIRTVYGQKSPGVLPPSPVTAEFTKYITHPVNMYNGLADVSIPLYTIQLKGGLSIPISLSYHGSGIKVGQERGQVGQGWVVNPGYRISRTMYGYADERETMPDDFSDAISRLNAGAELDKYVARFMPPNESDRPSCSYDMQLDGEYDQFSYSLPAESGSFIIKDRKKKLVQNLDESSLLQTTYSLGTSINNFAPGILGFKLTDDAGNRYHFGEYMSLKGNYVCETTSSQYNLRVNTAWALTDIVSPLQENVHFDYSQINVGGWNPRARNLTIAEVVNGWGDDHLYSFLNENNEGVDGSYISFAIDQITSPNETVKISHTNGSIASISIYNKSNELYKSIQFYSNSGLLDSLSIHDQLNKKVEMYRFNYYKDQLPQGALFVADQWGYYLQASNSNNVYHKQFEDDQMWLLFRDGGPNGWVTMRSLLTGTQRDDLYTGYPPTMYALKSITYPTGGMTQYTYESNRYCDDRDKNGGGLRIKQIKSTDGVTGQSIIRDYVYGVDESGSGTATLLLRHHHFASQAPLIQLFCTLWSAQQVVSYTSNVQGDIDPGGFISSPVVYPQVAEYISSTTEGNTAGKTIYNYDLGYQFSTNSYAVADRGMSGKYFDYPHYTSRYRYWDKPKLSSQLEYRRTASGAYEKIKETVLSYESFFNVFSGLKVRPYARLKDAYYIEGQPYYNDIASFFRFGEYTLESGAKQLKEKKETLYSSAGTTTTTTSYSYNSRGQLSVQTEQTSNYEPLKTYYRYPQEVVSQVDSLASAVSCPIGFMVRSNMIGKPLETQQTITISGQEKVLSASFTGYKGWQINRTGTPEYTVLPYKEYTSVLEQPLLKSSYVPLKANLSNNTETLVYDPCLEAKLTFDEYNSYGNLSQYTVTNGTTVSYLWDYANQFPVAQGINAPLQTIAHTSFEAEGKGNMSFNQGRISTDLSAPIGTKCYTLSTTASDYITRAGLTTSQTYLLSYWVKQGVSLTISGGTLGTPVSTQSLNNWTRYERTLTNATSVSFYGSGLIDDIKLYPAGAHMSSYSYKPLVGMTSSTDIKGQTMYYEYDDYHRLKCTKDQDGNIIKVLDYNYKH